MALSLEELIEDRLTLVVDRAIAEEIANTLRADKDFRRVLQEYVRVRARAMLDVLLAGKG